MNFASVYCFNSVFSVSESKSASMKMSQEKLVTSENKIILVDKINGSKSYLDLGLTASILCIDSPSKVLVFLIF